MFVDLHNSYAKDTLCLTTWLHDIFQNKLPFGYHGLSWYNVVALENGQLSKQGHMMTKPYHTDQSIGSARYCPIASNLTFIS